MSDLQQIEAALQRAARRCRWLRAVNGLWLGLAAGGLVLLLTLAAYKLFPIPKASLVTAGIAGGACLLAGFILAGWRKTSLSATARCVDDRQHLQERLGTARDAG